MYELFTWGSYSPVLRDVKHLDDIIKLANADALTSEKFELLAAKLTEVPTEEIAQMRKLVSKEDKSKMGKDLVDYVTYTVITNLNGKHDQVSLTQRWGYGFNKRLAQIRGLASRTWNHLTAWAA